MGETTQEIFDLLNSNQIKFKFMQHKAAYTVEDLLKLNLPDEEAIAKNLFIRDDKKQNYYLLVVCQEKIVDLKTLKEKIGSRRLSFASEEDLNSILGLSKGSVTPLGIIRDEARKVKVIFDKAFIDKLIGIHPNENTTTIWLEVSDLVNIIKQHGNSVEFVDI